MARLAGGVHCATASIFLMPGNRPPGQLLSIHWVPSIPERDDLG